LAGAVAELTASNSSAPAVGICRRKAIFMNSPCSPDRALLAASSRPAPAMGRGGTSYSDFLSVKLKEYLSVIDIFQLQRYNYLTKFFDLGSQTIGFPAKKFIKSCISLLVTSQKITAFSRPRDSKMLRVRVFQV
jgi:hypothetical protein